MAKAKMDGMAAANASGAHPDAAAGAGAPPAPDPAAVAALLSSAMPGTPPELAQRLFLEVADSTGLSGAPEDAADDAAKVTAALQALAAARPRDALEAMLAAQMAGCHAAAMRSLRRAARCTDYPEIEALYARQAARLMALFARQAEALRGWQAPTGQQRDAACAHEAQVAKKKRPHGGDSTPTQPSPAEGEGLSRRDPACAPAAQDDAGASNMAPSPDPLPPGQRACTVPPQTNPLPTVGEGRVRGRRRSRDPSTVRNGHRHKLNGGAPAH